MGQVDRSAKEEGPGMPTRMRAGRDIRAGDAGRRVPAWEDPAGRALAGLRAGGVPIAERRHGPGEPIY